MKLYMQVTRDEYEFPVVVTDNLKELSDQTGKTIGSIKSMLSRKVPGWVKVEVEDE